MDQEEYKEVLLAKERELQAEQKREEHNVQGEAGQEVRDWSDEAVVDEDKGIDLTEADADSALLSEVRDALQRIADGTFGKCKVDGKPIEEKRLRQIPWARYCLKHQSELERDFPRSVATL